MPSDKERVGQAIARLREMRGLTQSQLNELVGMSTIQHIEQGRNAVSMACLNKIAKALKIPAGCILLLGAPVPEDDPVMSSLRALLEQTINLQTSQTPQKSGRKKSSQTKVDASPAGKKSVVRVPKKNSKKEKTAA